MLTVSPFRALMPPPERAAAVSAAPYDVMDTAEARHMADGNPHTFLRVSRPEIEFADDVDPHGNAIYQRAAENLEKLRTSVPLVEDEAPHFYVYSLEREGHRQSGLVAAFSVDDYDEGRIQQHERTRPLKVDDRTRHVLATRTHSGPVFLVCRSMWSMDSVVQEVMGKADPLFDVAAEDATGHQIWRIPETYNHLIMTAFRKTRAVYIADGHHRAKSASEARARCREENPDHTGEEAYNRFLGVIFPHNQLQILPYNRVVADLNGLDEAAFLARVSQAMPVVPIESATPAARGFVHMYLAGRWLRLDTTQLPAAANPSDMLDVSRLQHHVLGPILGIDDPRTSKRIEFVGGIRGTTWLEQLVDNGKAAVAFSMYPTTIEELIAISEMGEVMPPKSTWFEPKLRDGLLIHTF